MLLFIMCQYESQLVASCMYEARPWEKITVGMYLNYEPMFGKNKNGVGNTFFGVVVGSNF